MIRLAVTPGEPAGVGPELMYHLARKDYAGELVVIGSAELIRERLGIYPGGGEIRLIDYDPAACRPSRQGELHILNVDPAVRARCGVLDRRNAPYVLKCLDLAVEKSLAGEFAGLVTGPVSKAVIAETGMNFTGHTEYLQQLTGTPAVVMLLGCEELRVALATTHLPLSAVPAALTPARLEAVVRILERDLRLRFGYARPLILAAGLNPHAGENGHLGREELETIIPVFDRLRNEGLAVEGPYPADTLFTRHNLDRAAAFLTMYHDQGLPVLKYIGFDHGYNTTLGLPFIRTSVDHGTAMDLAGSGRADPGSLGAAVTLAFSMARRGRT